MSKTATVRSRDRKVFANIAACGRQSLRQIAKAVGLTKDSVARSLAAMFRRNKYPESQFWETEEGQAWLCLLVIGTVYVFGIKGNQGAERISEFFKLIRINTHVGVSPSALRTMKRQMEELLVEFGRMQEEKQRQEGGAGREIVGSGDETWFNGQMLLVLMDLVSGYLVLEEEAEDRSYKTWETKAQSRLQQLGLTVRHFVSDRGKALMKLATSSFGCLAGADIFHAQYDISKWLGRFLHGKLGRASQQLKEAEEKMASLEEKKAAPEKIAKQEQAIEQCQEEFKGIEAGKQAYDEAQHSVSAAVHAFSVEENTPQTSEQVENRLEEQAQRFEQIAKEQSVPDNKDVVGKFRRQLKDVASIVDAWWLWTKESLESGLAAELRYWLLYVLLPVIYWHHQFHKTQNPEMKKRYETALRQAQMAYATHPVTRTMSKKDLDRWRSWAEWASGNFHRASSAVEGRNGCLAQSYHNGRGLTGRRLGALTTIHNYDTRRRDGSTPAERLYGERFPDLFDWLLEQIGALPLPREARQRTLPNPLDFKPVAA
jgi:hypothetical protein